MQQATHPRLHVRDARDAHTVFEAVRQGFLLPVTRRLNETERSMHIHSGAIFVWEESADESGLKRWTDGRIWGQSRMREPYLFYDEKLFPDGSQQPLNQLNRQPIFRFVDGVSRNGHTSSAFLHQDRSGGQHGGLVKQAYSAWVSLPGYTQPRKWHLTAYFTYADLHSIPIIDQDPLLSKIIVPVGIYRGGKTRTKNDDLSPPPSPEHVKTIVDFSHHQPKASATPALPSLHSTVGCYIGAVLQPRSQTLQPNRMSEDQRLIQILNSRYVS